MSGQGIDVRVAAAFGWEPVVDESGSRSWFRRSEGRRTVVRHIRQGLLNEAELMAWLRKGAEEFVLRSSSTASPAWHAEIMLPGGRLFEREGDDPCQAMEMLVGDVLESIKPPPLPKGV